ncbi:DUF4199 domain-containing protein [Galbibacter sp.]|uniref:DUF4199 domain-containing protein n=1 Tax=Galbibacter sp. TaxID=2918471 RepID=UPI003A901ECE
MEVQKTALKYGIITGAVLIIYFLLLAMIDLHTQAVYSILNIVITAAGIFLAIRRVKKIEKEDFKYQFGFAVGIGTGFTATVIFTLFSVLYITALNPNFTQVFMKQWEFEWSATNGMLLLTIFLMGLATTVVLTLSFMQLFKDSWNTIEASRHTLSKHNNVKPKGNH